MKDYEEKVLNIIDKAKEDVRIQLDKAYQQGLEDAWETANKIMRMDIIEKDAIFAEFGKSTRSVIMDMSASEAIAKIKEYEEQKKQDAEQEQDTEIKVGDEVVLNGNASYENEIGIILAYDGQSYPYHVLMSNGDSEWIKEDAIERKTGRHFDQISEVLTEMRGEE